MTPPTLLDVLDWWLGDASEEDAARVEEAIFSADDALAQAEWIAALARAVQRATPGGGVMGATLTRSLSRRLEGAGIPHTAYAASPDDTVMCAATPDQRFAVIHLRADFEGAERVDVILRSPHLGEMRLDDVPVNWDDQEVALLQAGDMVRSMPTTDLNFEVRATKGGAEVVLGNYLFKHHAIGDALE